MGKAATASRASAFEVPPRGGERLSMGTDGHEFWVKASAQQTGGSFSLSESTSDAGGSVGGHVHDAEDEVFYVLDGEYRFTISGEQLLARAGELIFIPRGAPHTFTVGPNGGRCLTIFTPGGYEGARREIASAQEQGALTPEFWARLGAEHRTRSLEEADVAAITSPHGFAVSPDEAERIDWPGVRIKVLASADRTAGSFTLLHDNCDAFTIPWHVHEDDEAFYVLKGRYRIRCEGHTFEGGPGTLFFLPRHVPHEQSVLTDDASKLALLAPAGIEAFFRAMADAINSGTMTPARKQDIAQRHRMRFLEDGKRAPDTR